MLHPYKTALTVLAAYLFIITFTKANMLATPLALISMLLLINPPQSKLHQKLGESGIALITTILLVLVILHQNFSYF
tara:strand:- start:88 stop:318 length:231 start_codon:yes stop_codon:yes gene_type:complete